MMKPRGSTEIFHRSEGTQKAQRFVNEAEPGEAEQIEATKKKNLHRQQRQGFREDARLRVRIARLQLEAQDKARQAELDFRQVQFRKTGSDISGSHSDDEHRSNSTSKFSTEYY
ncbi:hypothetical protein F2P81_007493 [Scophthalmus maximus]|uniref:Uncharacterized protein n=1 Tax=Scophthalmus maximus TaxID=52904 RepID=A0A6A4T4J1_SCOMX|nr:hypothetical protein F2P81_007493 [Scophthalmus maximus]